MLKNLSHVYNYFVSDMKKRAAICGGLLKLEINNVDLPKIFLIIPLISF